MRSQDRRSVVYEEESQKASTPRQTQSMAEMPQVSNSIPVVGPAVGTCRRAAFIGTRRVDDVSRACHDAYLDLLHRLVTWGWTIRTGAAKGADQIAAMSALHLGGRVELVLPWANYEKVWVNEASSRFGTSVDYEVYDDFSDDAWTQSVHKYHPAAHKLYGGAFSLHARNYGIIEPCDIVVALPAPDRKGGTEQGIRIAMGLNKPYVVLASYNRGGRLVSSTGADLVYRDGAWLPFQSPSTIDPQ